MSAINEKTPGRHWMRALLFVCCLQGAVAYAAEVEPATDFPKLSLQRDWPWWRGPSRNGIAVGEAPTKWSSTQNVIWRTPVPGRGHASPIVVGDQVFLATADEATQVQSVLAYDRKTGLQEWKTDLSQGGFPARNHAKNTAATSTVASDGERLFISLFHDQSIEAIALDLSGKEIWRRALGPFNPKKYEYGYAPSPLVYRGTIIISAEYDGDSFLTAVDRASGKQAWRAPRPRNISFSSPVVGHVAGKDQLLISGADEVTSYDPATGAKLWAVAGTATATCGTAVWDGDTVFASGGYPSSDTLAVRADGSAKVLWRNKQKCYEQSMLAHDGHLYALTGGGVAYCWRGGDGKQMWSKRLVGPVSASPVLVGGHIYWANELGTMYVFKANPQQFELVAENQLDDEAFASPAVSAGQLFLRTATNKTGQRQEFLNCLGE